MRIDQAPAESSDCNDCSEGARLPANVRLATGEFVWQQEDMRIAGRGLDLVWTRTFRSRPESGGRHWDHAYNLRAQAARGGIRVWKGTGAADLYRRGSTGAYAARGVFAEGRLDAANRFFLRFSGGGAWEFRPLDDRSAAGQVAGIVDRNGNALRFAYDESGRLAVVTDTLGRDIHLGYDRVGRLITLTDFTGRRVSYRYGQDDDLESVTYPAVTGTPTGNDFPEGASVGYTYSAAHRLAGITDRAGQPLVDIEYAAAFDHDRVSSLTWGRSGSSVHFSYHPAEDSAGLVAIVNDGNGNVRDFLLDERGACVGVREYTNRADATRPVTLTENRPAHAVRPGVPSFYETRYSYDNPDGLLTRIVHPDGSMIEKRFEIDLNSDASPIERGNLRSIRYTPGQAGGEQPELVHEFDYLPGFGCSCSQAFVVKATDPRGGVRSMAYDDRGNLVLVIDPDGAETRLAYNAFGDVIARESAGDGTRVRRDRFEYAIEHGQLTSETIDADGIALTTSYEYDELGRLVLLRDPAGGEHRYVWNAWDLLVRRALPDDAGILPSIEDTRYDANHNPVARVVHESGRVLTETRTYDALGRLLTVSRRAEEAGPPVVTTYEYDGNGNRVATRSGESRVVRLSYDALDRPYRRSRGELGKGYRETTFDYDLVGNLVRVTQGTGAERSVTHAHYDGYGRLVRIEAPNGTIVSLSRDANGNVLRQVARSPGDDEPTVEIRQSFDAMGRLVRRTTSGAGIDEAAIESWEFDRSAQPIRWIDATGRAWRARYDVLGRRVEIDDGSGRVITSAYDRNSNVLEEAVTHRATGRHLRTRYVRDPRGRVLEVAAPRGMSRTYAYDRSDRPGTIGLPNRSRVRLDYDGLGRPTRANWIGADGSDAIEVRQSWDDGSRLVARTDPNGNTTRYLHDAADNLVAIEHADGTKETFRFDTRGNCIGWTDPNGSTVVNTYDLTDRLVRRDITPGIGVAADTTTESYQYDALGRLIRAANDRHTAEWTYDALSRVVTQVQDGRVVHATYDGRGRRTSVRYPSGYRLHFDYEGANLRCIRDSRGPVVELETGGTTRYARTPVTASAAWNANGLPERLVTTRGSTTLDERQYHWDESGTLAGIDVRNSRGSRHVSYTVDFLGRLRASASSAGRQVEYELDPAGNRALVRVEGKEGRYSMEGAGDRATNRYTVTPTDRRTYDANGNLLTVTDTHGRRRSMRYDYRNRMVEYRDEATGAVTRYGYDCLGRRLVKTLVAGERRVAVTTVFDADATVEEVDAGSGTTRSMVRYGASVYGMVAGAPGKDRWFIADALGSIVAELDESGTVTSVYEYGDYGEVPVQDPSAPVLFAGYTYDEESGLYYVRTRYLEPATGRFTTRDSAGVWEDSRHRGNAYAYAGNNPAAFVDPTGLVTRHISCSGPWPGPRIISVEYQGCSKARRDLLDQPVCRAFRASGQSMERVMALWMNDFSGVPQPGAQATRLQVQKWFGGPDNATNTYSKSYIGNTLGYVLDATKSGDFDIDCEGGGGTCSTANAYVAWGGSDVNLCNNFFNSGLSIDKQAAIIIHELTHAYADTDDYFYYPTDGSNWPWNLLFETPVMRENADTYEQFTLEFFLPASAGPDSSGVVGSKPEAMPPSIGAAAWRFGFDARTKRIDIFARGDDHRVYQLFQKDGEWSTWAPHAGEGTFDSGPAAASWGASRLDVFAIGKDRRLYHTFWNGSAWSGWHVPVAAAQATFSSGPAVASWGPSRLDVFARGDDHRLYHLWHQEDLGWSLGPLGGGAFDGTFDSGPAAASWGPGRLDVFAVGKDRRMYHYWWHGGGWNFGPLGFDATFSSAPAAASWGPNRLDVIARGEDHRLYHLWYHGLGWSLGPLGAGTPVTSGTFNSGPAAVSVASNRLDVFVVGKDRRMWRAAWKNDTWSGWFDDMGNATFS